MKCDNCFIRCFRLCQWYTLAWLKFLPPFVLLLISATFEGLFAFLYHMFIRSRAEDYVLIDELILNHNKKEQDDQNKNKRPKVAIVTGSSSGIGIDIALGLARAKYTVILACRSKQKTQPIVEKIRLLSNNDQVHFIQCDLASKESIEKFVEDFGRRQIYLDLLVNNAGVCLDKFTLTKEKFESTLGINHLGHFVLTLYLKQYFHGSPRIVNIGSTAHYAANSVALSDFREQKKNQTLNYAISKLANALFTVELSKRWSDKNAIVTCVHPGGVMTNIYEGVPSSAFLLEKIIWRFFPWFLFDPRQGSLTPLYVALNTDTDGEARSKFNGKFFMDMQEIPFSEAVTQTDEAAKRLWKASLDLMEINENKK